MKTYQDFLVGHPYPHILTKGVYEQIQLDTYRAGMMRAAEIAEKRNYFGNNNPMLGNATQDILTAANSLKPEDLK